MVYFAGKAFMTISTDISSGSAYARHQSHQKGGWERLVAVVQQLSLARDLATLMDIVRRAARELTGADGATFVLRDGDDCFYAEEDAVAPLWKGRRFPMSACISGWVMLNRQPVVIDDIYADPRVPADAYRPTFVQSLAIVPIRTRAPLGAIGNYWATRRRPTESEVALLSALADTTCVAMENITVYQELEDRVRRRTLELEAANQELEAFSAAVSHDLRSPLTAILGLSDLLCERDGPGLDVRSRKMLAGIGDESRKMDHLITALLELSRTGRGALRPAAVDVTALADDIVAGLRQADPGRRVAVQIERGLTAWGDSDLVRSVLTNLLSNAWKYTSRTAEGRIVVGRDADAADTFFVRDNGAGFDPATAGRLFLPFSRLHADAEFPGVGIGLATVRRIVQRHGGRIWATGAVGQGATFYVTLPAGR
jgi:signal transduction histidine kinase